MFHNQELVENLGNLRKFALHLTGNIPDAEDLVQATVLCALEKKDMFRDDSNLQGWTSKIMFNLFVSEYRRKKKFDIKDDPENHINARTIEPAQNHIVEVNQMVNALQLLPDSQKEIITLICVHDLQYQDAAEQLSIPIGTVRSRLARARINLRNIMDNPAAYAATAH